MAPAGQQPRRRMVWTRSAAVVVGVVAVLAVVAAGCGGDDSDAAETGGGQDAQATGSTATSVAAVTTTPSATTTTLPAATTVTITSTTNPCSGEGGVGISSAGYQPKCVSVARGSTVTWTWTDPTFPHSVTSDGSGLFDSGVKTTGTFEYSFADAGTYAYYCTVHGRTLHAGTIEVT